MPHRDLQYHGSAVMEPLEQRFLLSGGSEHWQTEFIDPLVGDTYTQAVDFNDAGQVLVLSGDAQGAIHPCIWQDNVATEITPLIPGSQNPGFIPEVVAMNNSGLVLGNRSPDYEFTEFKGYILDPSTGQVVYIEPLEGDARTYAIDLANNGLVLAISEDAVLTKHVIIWQEGAVLDITSMVPQDEWGDPTEVVAINDLGQVLGQRLIQGEWRWEDTWRAFVLDTTTGVMQDMAPAGDDNNTHARRKNDPATTARTFAGDIDDLGRVVGISASEDYWSDEKYDRACIWDDEFPWEITFFLPGYNQADPFFEEYPPWIAAINNSGQILGTSDHDPAQPDDDRAYIMTPLEAPGAEVSIEKFQTLDVGGTNEYGYRVYTADPALSGLELTTPWGETIDLAAWLPPDWQGQHVTQQDGILSFEADTDQFDQRWFELVWAGLTSQQWYALETGQTDLTVVMTDAQWTGTVTFSTVEPPADVPDVTFPGPNEAGVPLSPTFQWDQWADAPDAGLTYLDLRRSSDGQSVYSLNLPADWTEWTVPGSLERNTVYELSIGFVYADAVMVNDLSVRISASAVCDRQFTTANGTVSQVFVERSQSGTGSGVLLGYSIESAGTDLQRLQVITPWGELFTSNGLLPAGWHGEDFSVEQGGFYFAAFTSADGQQRLAVRWSDLSQVQWEEIDENVLLVSVIYDGGLWQSARGFADVSMPDQVPALINLSDGQTGVGVLPLLEWSPWDSAGFGDIIRPWVSLPDPLWPAVQIALPSHATDWQPPQPLQADTTYDAGVEFVRSGWDFADGVEVTTQAVTRQLARFTTMPIGVSQADVRRTIDYGASGTALDDAYEYEVAIAGLGLTRARVTTPWGWTADTADLLDSGGDGLTPGDARVGPLRVAVREADGVTCLSLVWRCLSDDQWAAVASGSADIEVFHEGGSWSASGIGMGGVAQHLREPGPTQPVQDGIVEQQGLVEWQTWLGAPVNGHVDVEVMRFFGTMVALADSELPADASSWTLPPMSAGVAGIELTFANEASSDVNGTPVNRSSQTRSSVLMTVANPPGTTRVNPTTGHVYVLTPDDCTWAQAQAYARSMGGDLVTINDSDEEVWLGEQYCEEGGYEAYWMGLNDLDENGVWTWSSGEGVTYTGPGWSPGTGPTISFITFSRFGTLDTWWYADYPDGYWQMRGLLEFPAGSTPTLFDDHGNIASAATTLGVGDELDATLGYAGDVDWFAFEAVAGQAYEISVGPPIDSGDGPCLRDSTVWLYDVDGLTRLAWDDDGGSDQYSRLLWVAPAGGTYFVAVDAGEMEGFGDYSVSVSPSADLPDAPDGVFGDPAVSLYRGGNLAVAVSPPPPGTTWKDDAVLRLLDLSGGGQPTEIGRYAMADPAGSAIAVGDGAVFIADGSELIGLDVSGPGDPLEMWSLQLDQAEARALALEGDYLYVGTVSTDDGTIAHLAIYDVSNPTSPVLVGLSNAQEAPATSSDFGARKILVQDGLACVLFADGRTVGIFDVSAPSQPLAIGRFELPAAVSGQMSDIALVKETLLATVDWSLMAVCLSDPADPAVVGTMDLPGRGGQIQVAGGAVYVGCVSLGMAVVDVSDPTSPDLMRTYTVPSATGNLAIVGTSLYVPTTAGQMALFTIDAAAPTVAAVVINDNGQRRDQATAITFVFDTDVVVSYEALRFFDDLAQQDVPVPGGMAFNYDQSSHTARWYVSAMALPVGRYTAVLSATEVTTAKGIRLDGNKDGMGGDDSRSPFVVTVRGDANLDGSVDAADYIATKRKIGVTAGATWGNGDFDGDGDVDRNDLMFLTANFGTSLEAARAAAAPTLPTPTPADQVQADVTEPTEPTKAPDSPATVDVVAEPAPPTATAADAQGALAGPELPAAPVADAPSADILAMAAGVVGNRAVADSQGLASAAAGPAGSPAPVRVALRVGPALISSLSASTSPSPLPSAGGAGEAFADVLSLAAPWWRDASARHELPDEPWMTGLTLDIAGKPRKGKGRFGPIGLDVLALSR